MDKKNIEAIYPLAPLQQAFLWHSLQMSAQSGLLHVRCTLACNLGSTPSGELNETLFHQAWKAVVAAHPTLRTSVHWEGVKQPLQVVAKRVDLPWIVLDWREKENTDAALEAFLQADSDRSFNLSQAPISRITLIRLSETTYELVWTCHHLMLDGWSGALVLNQVVDAYESLRQGQSPMVPPSPTFQSYIRWQQQQDLAATKAFWQKTLAGFESPTALPFLQNSQGSLCESAVVMTVEETAAVNGFLRSHRLTLNTLMQGVWSLLLQGYSGASDVLFGATVSGRQGDLPGVESIVGLLINVLPVRVNVAKTDAVSDWLQALQRQQGAAAPHAHAALSDIQQWCDVPGRLFESLLVIENYPMRAVTSENEDSLRLENVRSGVVSTYGLTVLVKPGESLTIAAESAVVTVDMLARLLSQFSKLLRMVVEAPQDTVTEVLAAGGFPALSQSGAPSDAPVDWVTDSIAVSPLASRDSAAVAMPRSPLELTLLKIWASILGSRQQRPLGVEDSFFDWGGGSLLAVQLFNEMQQQLDCTLPLATLFQAPTVRTFAALLAQSQTQSASSSQPEDAPFTQWSSLVPIQPNGTQRPFFFHGGSADALTWARFSQLLGPDQPFYAFQRPDLDGREVTMLTVEALAAGCVEELRMVQPEGPYLLGGHCFGGAVAFEMAQQLRAAGHRVESVVMIDAYRPAVLPASRRIQLQTQLNLGLFWLRKNYYYYGNSEDFWRLPGKLWGKVVGRRRPADMVESISGSEHGQDLQSQDLQGQNIQSKDPLASANELSRPVAPIPYEVRYQQAIAANDWAAARYHPTDYDGPIQLFRANIQMLEWYFGPALGWETLVTRGPSVTCIPGFFGNLFNQHAAPVLAEQVKAYLKRLPVSESASDPISQPVSQHSA